LLRDILLVLALIVPSLLLTMYRVDGPVSTAATLWLIGGSVAAFLAGTLALRRGRRFFHGRPAAGYLFMAGVMVFFAVERLVGPETFGWHGMVNLGLALLMLVMWWRQRQRDHVTH
jgi:peptidoglycan/LPS O-acetylase OafA/YrhL